MNTTITLGDAGLLLIGLALLVLIIYCILFVRSLIPTIKNMNRILEDAQVISSIAAENAQGVNKIIGDVSSSVGSISDIIKGNQSVVAALTSLVNAIGSLKNLLNREKK
ncbi:hypothetical protein [Sinanaerobacter chloroacetimidivorans]|jgi:uncharacterized protein YoxC|uniref:DUF948 domain-containing protein n=1 Tax=Sinanaerobacter chloroacetimidivorans TaxID=2818044 RepID=A0A8J7W7B8_9FIRM|nr:hypothetical protein [Sinanaerobacter chloroacetimidivorans]MBR0600450.1 hypothetical protein [Sinanaerobacter chloroacetimidivorans]